MKMLTLWTTLLTILAISSTSTPALTLIPTDLDSGDTYHLVFVSRQGRDASSNNIVDYDRHVQDAADAAGIGLGSDIGDIAWLAIGSTPNVNAIAHIAVMAPVYRLDATLIAQDQSDLFDGTIQAAINLDETGLFHDTSVWTGTNADGFGSSGSALGTGRVDQIGRSAATDMGWISSSTSLRDNDFALYGISAVLTVSSVTAIPEPSTMILFASGLLGILGYSVRRAQQQASGVK